MTDIAKVVSVSVSVDVPNIKEGVRFYSTAFGFSKLSEPVPGIVLMAAANTTISLLERGMSSKPSIYADDVRRYDRHWTPVHLDIHVDNLPITLERVVKAGAKKDQLFENPEHGSAAFCSDPFGHGFCLLEKRR